MKIPVSEDEESIKERRCFDPKTYPNIDFEWFGSIKTWYFQMFSKTEVYRFASDALRVKISDVPESAVVEPCARCDPTFNCLGYGAKEPIQYESSLEGDFVLKFKAKSKYALGGEHIVTLTDNKDFVVGVSCWDDDEASFAVWTPTDKPISSEDKEQILAHLNKIGFDPKFYVDTPCSVQSEIKNEL